jgi:hypothetical protein
MIPLKDWNDYFKLPSELQEYLRTYYLTPEDAKLIKASAIETREAFRREWQETLEFEQKEEGFEPGWTVERATEDSLATCLTLFNSILAILFRREWPSDLDLFGDWIPFGVRAPQPGQQHIEIVDEPFFETYTSVVDYYELHSDNLGLLYYGGCPILFWRTSEKLPPITKLLRIDYESYGAPCNLWDDAAVQAWLRGAV